MKFLHDGLWQAALFMELLLTSLAIWLHIIYYIKKQEKTNPEVQRLIYLLLLFLLLSPPNILSIGCELYKYNR